MRVCLQGARIYLAPALLIVLVLSLLLPAPVLAQGVGLSGNFYRQHFELSPGETSLGEDVYVVVSNPSDSPVRVKMVTETPADVMLLLTQDDFTLNPGGEQKVNINVEASPQAVPGEYTITISAEAYREGTGIKVTSGGQQVATLSILGESGRVIISSVTQDGEPFPAVIGIYQEVDGELTEVRPLQKSKLEARLVPGDYLAQAHSQNVKLAEESFSLAADEEKEITLVCYTLCLADFSVSPVYSSDDKLTSAKIAYTIANLDKLLKDVRAVLKVELDGKPLDETELISFSRLDVGSTGGSYNYIPAQGWQEKHTYSFIIELYVGGKLRYQSAPQELTPGQTQPAGPAPTSAPLPTSPAAKPPISWPVLGGIIAGVVVIVVVVLLVRRRRAY